MQFPQTVASFKPVTHPISSYVLVFCNPLPAEIDYSAKKSPKYRKVGKATKNHLLDLVEQGSSIISVRLRLFRRLRSWGSIIQPLSPSSRTWGRALSKNSLVIPRRKAFQNLTPQSPLAYDLNTIDGYPISFITLGPFFFFSTFFLTSWFVRCYWAATAQEVVRPAAILSAVPRAQAGGYTGCDLGWEGRGAGRRTTGVFSLMNLGQ